MRRVLVLLGSMAMLRSGSVAAQLPQITAPRGALRIEFSGVFLPSDQVWIDGRRPPLGDLIDSPAHPAFVGLQTQLTQLLGHPVSGLSLSGGGTLAARERGVGDIGLALGITSRITLFAVAPIVYVRTRITPRVDPLRATVGLNPAYPFAANAAGRTQTTAFFTDFDAAVATLQSRIAAGAYDGDPTQLALAQRTLSEAGELRSSLFGIFSDPATASPVLPFSDAPLGVELRDTIAHLQTTLASSLDVNGFTSTPALPTQPATTLQLDSLITSPLGFGFNAYNSRPRYALGNVRVGAAAQLIRRGSIDSGSWRSVWLRAAAQFPTAPAADSNVLLDQATGDSHPALLASAIAEVGRGHVGLRAELGIRHAFAANQNLRVASPLAPVVPASYRTTIESTIGDSIALTLRPFFAFAPHLAVAGKLQYWRRGASHSEYGTGAPIPTGADASLLDVGSQANAVVIGLGLSYSHPGNDGPNGSGLPVEASWSIERTVHSGAGIFPDAYTTRVALRLYRPLLR